MAEPDGDQARKEATRADRFAWWLGRLLIFMAVALFVGAWAWFFATVLRAGQYSWAFWSLLLFALFMLASVISPGRQASRFEMALASAKLLVEFEAPNQAEAVIERVKAAIPAEARKAVEEATPQLVEEATRAFMGLSERAALQALASSSASIVSSGPLAGLAGWSTPVTLSWEDWEDVSKRQSIRAAVIARQLAKKPTDPSSGSARGT